MKILYHIHNSILNVFLNRNANPLYFGAILSSWSARLTHPSKETICTPRPGPCLISAEPSFPPLCQNLEGPPIGGAQGYNRRTLAVGVTRPAPASGGQRHTLDGPGPRGQLASRERMQPQRWPVWGTRLDGPDLELRHRHKLSSLPSILKNPLRRKDQPLRSITQALASSRAYSCHIIFSGPSRWNGLKLAKIP